MFKIAILAVATAGCVLFALTSRQAPPRERVLEAGHCTFWQCSASGEQFPTQLVCAASCPGGTCTPVDICQ